MGDATIINNIVVIGEFLQVRADINHICEDCYTALMRAVQ